MAKERKISGKLIRAAELPDTTRLLADLRELIEAGRERVAQTVNAGLVVLYWTVGERIPREVLDLQRAAYGKQILSTLSIKLAAEYGRGFSTPNLFKMTQF